MGKRGFRALESQRTYGQQEGEKKTTNNQSNQLLNMDGRIRFSIDRKRQNSIRAKKEKKTKYWRTMIAKVLKEQHIEKQ